MREIKISNVLLNVRGLTRGELKQLRRDGFDLTDIKTENAEEAVDRAFDIVFSESEIEQIDNLVNSDAMVIWRVVLDETYGSRDEEKNLPASGPGTQTPSE